jgi:chemotaxis protein methyltransferase CheR
VRALANIDPTEAERACAAAVEHHPLSPELQFLWSALLLDLGRDEDAARALRRVLYLDRSLAAAHFALAAIVRRQGDVEGARRAYRNARALCVALPPDAVLPLTDGEHANRLAEAADVELALLEAQRAG